MVIIEHDVYATSQVNCNSCHSQRLLFNSIEYFITSRAQLGADLQEQKETGRGRLDFKASFLLPIKNQMKNIYHR